MKKAINIHYDLALERKVKAFKGILSDIK